MRGADRRWSARMRRSRGRNASGSERRSWSPKIRSWPYPGKAKGQTTLGRVSRPVSPPHVGGRVTLVDERDGSGDPYYGGVISAPLLPRRGLADILLDL